MGLQIGAKRLQIGAAFEVTNWGKKITNRGRDYKSVQNNFYSISGIVLYKNVSIEKYALHPIKKTSWVKLL